MTREHRAVWRFACRMSLALLVWNNLLHSLRGASSAYVPLNVTAAVLVTGVARRQGLSWGDLGLTGERVRSGLRWGGAAAATVVGGIVLASAHPCLRPLFDDARVRRLDAGAVTYHAMLRIPLGTVLLEELAFRGALYGALVRVCGPLRAAVASSAVFGLWHIRPTLGLLDANGIGNGLATRAGLVAAGVVITAAGGLFFCLLRVRSGSTLAPILAHIATNSFGLLASAAAR